ncbi:MAG: ABC-2 family transporter protein [Candidatus Nanoarchaeia archaeon]|nr:ABC-2 family transporter protein [Candidatus Nanoarchaeia archaeon]
MSLFLEYVKIKIKDFFSYRFTLFLFLLIDIIYIISLSVPFLIIYSATEGFPNWNIYELFFFTTTGIITSTLIFTFAIVIGLDITDKIKDGSFDLLLLKPVNIYYHMLIQSLDLRNFFPDFPLFLIILIILYPLVGILFSWINLFYFILIIFISCLIFIGFSGIFISFSFFVPHFDSFWDLFFSFREISRKPIDIYKNKFIVLFLTFVFPFALWNYYPASILMGKIDTSIVPSLVLMAIIFLAIGFFSLKYGLKHYKSANG